MTDSSTKIALERKVQRIALMVAVLAIILVVIITSVIINLKAMYTYNEYKTLNLATTTKTNIGYMLFWLSLLLLFMYPLICYFAVVAFVRREIS